MKIALLSTAQISIQKPLQNDWLQNPIFYNQRYVRAIEPDFKPFISPVAARRMGILLKRALATSIRSVLDSKITDLQAIIIGTGLGCIANTEHFLLSMVKEGEQFLQPTFFMQSTHNTISSQIALQLKCHGYNSTYSHLGVSFESALFDAWQQLESGKLSNALVGGHDEMTPNYFDMLDKSHLWKKGEINTDILHSSESKGSFAGESAVSFVLSNEDTSMPLCYLSGMDLLYRPTAARLHLAVRQLLQYAHLAIDDVDAVFIGANGDSEFDSTYLDFCQSNLPDVPIVWYKHLFGESYTSSGLGVYAAATCLSESRIPDFLYYSDNKVEKLKNILVYNHFQNKEHSLILLSNA